MRIAALLFATLCSLAHAEETRTFAILSLLGDRLTVVQPAMTTGSRLDRSTHVDVKLDTPALDHAALLAADSAVRQALPGAKTRLLFVSDPAIYAAQARFAEDATALHSILPILAPVLAGSGATHLILLTKMRQDALFEAEQSHVGQGRIEGLGFYVDRITLLHNIRRGDEYGGFLAPYAYFCASLADLGTGKVIETIDVPASEVHGMNFAVHPWDELTPEQKIESMRRILDREIGAVVPRLLAKMR